ncbi:MAG: ATP-binding protein, partial [Planctomycetota bacterium]
LRQTSQTQATVLEGMTESVVAVDQSESILFANEAAGRVLGFGPRDVQGRKLLEVVRSHELRNSVRSALESRTLNSCDLSWRSDTERTFQVLATPLPGEPCPGVVVVLRDVTELKRLEGMRQQFVANVSHELKTPLSSIKAYTETLLSGAVRDPQHGERFLQRIDEQANRLHQLIMDLLSLARIESGQAALEISPVSVIAVVQQCLTDFEPQASGSGIDLKNGVGDLPLLVSADEESLRLILGNLIDNAIKYTPAGGSVAVSARQATDVTVIEVADTGIGIAAADHQRLFERFYRVDKARSRELGGTGLGLSIVKHLSQAMGGSVAVRSELGRGSVFSVILPNVES